VGEFAAKPTTQLADQRPSAPTISEVILHYYSRYTYSSHSFGYSFSFSLKVLGVRAIVLGFRVRDGVRIRVRVRVRIRVRVRVRVRVRSRGLGDQNYEVGFETIGTVTQNYANFDYSGYFSLQILINITSLEPGRFSVQKARMNNQLIR
jgi:hypothetical protein